MLPSARYPRLDPCILTTGLPGSKSTSIAAWLARLGLQDRLCLAYHVFMSVRLLLAPPAAGRTAAQLFSVALLATTAGVIVLGHGGKQPVSRPRAMIYRFGVLASMILSYFELGVLLPALSPDLLDISLYRLDCWLFGETPAIWLARFATPAVVEWFAFFYFSYFLLLGVVLLPSLSLLGSRAAAQLQLGAVIVACIGHISYTFVPGVGPYAALSFVAPLEGSFWWRMVLGAVGGGGAQLDIFPSLHTAYPSFFALFALSNRTRPGFRGAWPLLCFFALNIVISTMLLRWHYAIDVVCGLLLAFGAERIARRI